jgi:penicillin-binding protein 1C
MSAQLPRYLFRHNRRQKTLRSFGTLLKRVALGAGVAFTSLAAATVWSVETPSLDLRGATSSSGRFAVLDKQGQPIGVSYQNRFNVADIRPLHEVPETLRRAIITAEDRRFFEHSGIDWQARLGAVWQSLRAGRAVRGASTITEQVVRIVHPRPRNLWSRWLEGFEAMLLERKSSKGEVLAFYLNQVPYASNRRGVAQAARFYFNRDMQTLTKKEMLALAVFPRAPTALDPRKRPEAIDARVKRLALAMQQRGEMTFAEIATQQSQPLAVEDASSLLNAGHFITYIRETVPYRMSEQGTLKTSLDGALQQQVQSLLDERLKALRRKNVHNGAALVIDHQSGEILAWVVAGATAKNPIPGSAIDAVRTPRQPGSSMKPFLYALALENGWSPATELDDAPMAEAIGTGLHDFKNYSHTFYGKIPLRDALGNSLNIPALETIAFVTPQKYLDKLHELGFASLSKPAAFYNDGLALGNGEVTLLEMVQGFSALANRGIYRPLTPLAQAPFERENRRVFSGEAASLIGNILSDSFARRHEFGAGSVLNLPTQTAVKTGTSTDYRDAWVLGYNAHYTVGVWLGNLDQMPMDGVTGSTGPALVLRGIFAELEARQRPQPLWLSPRLQRKDICSKDVDVTDANCFPRTEYFMPDTVAAFPQQHAKPAVLDLVRPTEGLQLAYDPRVPKDVQAFEFVASGVSPENQISWLLNGKLLSTTSKGRLLWPIERGSYTLMAQELNGTGNVASSKTVHFIVK